ncbi:MAG: chaperone NapD [Burkholderiaceae bacterium]|nr:chaperone NapD [Burkholderiaceae bacterium]
MPAELHIASLVVHVLPRRVPALAAWIGQLPGARVHAHNALGKLVVTLEAGHERGLLDVLGRIQRAAGVLSATLVYQCVDSLDAMNEELSP